MRRGLRSTLLAWFAWSFLACAPASAQDTRPDGPPGRLPAPDFLLKRPLWSIGVRGAWVLPREGSDLFDFVRETLTIDKGDFRGGAVGADVAFALTPRIDAVFGLEFGRSSAESEYRDYVDDDFLPIEQTTGLRTVHVTGEFRYAFAPRGYRVSSLAWVPRRLVPYAGAGAGAAWYEFWQTGDFVDYVDLAVFRDDFRSKGWTPTAHAFGGVELHLHKHLFATGELRYVWANAPLGPDFVDFEPIDLAGFRTGAGVRVVF